MSDDDAIEVPAPPRYELPEQHAAEDRCTLAAPQHDRGYGLPPLDETLNATLASARSLFAVATHPFTDPAYRRLEPGLRIIDRHLERAVRDAAGDELFDLFEEVRDMLMHGRHA